MNLVSQYLTYLMDECNLAPSTALSYSQGLDRLVKFCMRSPEQITVADLRRYLREAPGTPRTKHLSLAAIKSFHRWGHLEGYWSLDGIMSVRGPRIISDPKPSLSPREARALLSSCRTPNEHRLVYLGLLGGLRIAETASIDRDSWLEGRLRFVGKGRKSREVPLHPHLSAKRGEVLAHNTTVAALHQSCKVMSFRVGIAFSSHTLRRTFAVGLSEAGVQREVIGSILGHAPASVTERYAPVRWSEKVEAILKLRY
jgi:site-specific recombinase XerD